MLGPTTRAVENRGSATGDCFHRLDAPAHVVVELVTSLIVNEAMRVPVRCRLVPALDDFADELRIVRRRHTEEEKRRFRVELVEQREQSVDLVSEARIATIPVGQSHPSSDELVPILEVDAEK